MTVVTGEGDSVVVLCKMPYIFTNAEYANMPFVYDFCDGSGTAALKSTVDGFLCAEFRILVCFPSCSIYYVNVLRFPVLMFHLKKARQQHVEEQENILEMVQRSHTTNTRRLSPRLGVSRTRVWRTLHEDGLYQFHPQRVQNLYPGNSAIRVEFCHR